LGGPFSGAFPGRKKNLETDERMSGLGVPTTDNQGSSLRGDVIISLVSKNSFEAGGGGGWGGGGGGGGGVGGLSLNLGMKR